MQTPPPQAIQQPMGFAAQVHYGGFWIRVVAYLIDAILLGIIGGVIIALFGIDLSDPNLTQNGRFQGAQVFDLIVSFAYFAGLWTVMGASLGQRVFGMRILDANTGSPIGFGKAALRWVGLVVSFFICFIGVLWVAWDSRKQGLMDKLAGTVVVRA